MAILKNTTINDTGFLQITSGPTANRPIVTKQIQSFTSVGTTSWTAPAGVTAVEVLVVAGGGGGASNLYQGGGGAGGLIYRSSYSVTSGSSYTVTVGSGGAVNNNGANSVFDTLIAIGGGRAVNGAAGATGGSGGGGAYSGNNTNGFSGGAGTPGQGNAGGQGGFTPGFGWGGGGGGAGQRGADARANSTSRTPGSGGNGLNFSITGTPTWYAGGGGGHIDSNGFMAIGGLGGGGRGSDNRAIGASNTNGTAGTPNTGGGGGWNAAGGSGIVIISYSVIDNSDPRGIIYYNTDVKDLEVYENNYSSWTAQDPTRNFAGHNLYRYSQDMSNAVWLKDQTTVSTNTTIAPDGTLTADSVFESANNTFHRILTATPGNVFTAIGNRIYTFSVYVKRLGGERHIFFMTQNGINGIYAHYDMTLNIVHQSGSSGNGSLVNASITPENNDWYRLSITGIVNTSTVEVFNQIYYEATPRTGFSNDTYQGITTAGFAVWNWQVEEQSLAGPPVRTLDVSSPVPTSLGGYRTHTYTTIGTSGFTAACTGLVEVLVVGGGGGGGANHAGGGGAGGLIYSSSYNVISGKQYTVTVGGGGATPPSSASASATNGGDSIFATLIAAGGGGGGNRNDTANIAPGRSGGSGGGGGGAQTSFPLCYEPGASISGQGNPGGRSVDILGGGGGGAGAPGRPGTRGGNGGNGLPYAISGYSQYYAGGGGGGFSGGGTGVQNGGLGGGGIGGYLSGDPGTAGTPNTGGGGGGGGAGGQPGSAGGSGIVIVRYKN
jgi:hypothetical protein